MEEFESAILGSCNCRNCIRWTGKIIVKGQVVGRSYPIKTPNGISKRCQFLGEITHESSCCKDYKNSNI
jgi:hypothetical protein